MATQLALWQDDDVPAGQPGSVKPAREPAPPRQSTTAENPREKERAAVESPGAGIEAEEPRAAEAPRAEAGQAAVVAALRQAVQRVETGGRGEARGIVSCGAEVLDQLLPAAEGKKPGERGPTESGLHWGTLVEWVEGQRGDTAGGELLALLAARQALRASGGRSLVVLDGDETFHPPAAIALGIPADRLVLVRPPRQADLIWAADQALRCSAVAAVWGRIERLDARDARRLQLAAEAGRTLGLLVRPAAALGQPSWAEVRWGVSPVAIVSPAGARAAGRDVPLRGPFSRFRTGSESGIGQSGRRLRVELLRSRGLAGRPAAVIEIDGRTGAVHPVGTPERGERHETGAVSLAAQLARATAAQPRPRHRPRTA